MGLLLVPTIIYGGLTVLGIFSGGRCGVPAPPDLSPLQVALYRAMHAHAGVLTLLALFLQIALDHVVLPAGSIWPLRLSAFAVPLLVSGGFVASGSSAAGRSNGVAINCAYLPRCRQVVH